MTELQFWIFGTIAINVVISYVVAWITYDVKKYLELQNKTA